MFQFHEGPIKTSACSFSSFAFSCFNSMKVRLKHLVFPQYADKALFQFHEGPIKTVLKPKYLLQENGFNSMKVRLKR